MKAFDHFNAASGARCPVCQTTDDKPTVLIGKDGTEKGSIMEAIQVHLDCIELRYRSDLYGEVFYQIVSRAQRIKESA